jgi:hypothetical protein
MTSFPSSKLYVRVIRSAAEQLLTGQVGYVIGSDYIPGNATSMADPIVDVYFEHIGIRESFRLHELQLAR